MDTRYVDVKVSYISSIPIHRAKLSKRTAWRLIAASLLSPLIQSEPLKAELISPEDAQGLMKAVASGQMPIKEAYQLVENIISSTKK